MKYLRYSNLKIALDINPFAWRFKWAKTDGFYYLRMGPLSFLLTIDDGVIPIALSADNS